MAWYRCGMNGTYNATTVSRSGAVCNYVANVGGVPLSRFIANITPVQAGSGDPSPSNPRAITGWSAVNVARTGKNLLKNAMISQTYNGVIFTANDDGTITLSGQATSEAIRNFHFYLPAGSYTYTSEIIEDFSTYDTYITRNGVTIARGNSRTPGHDFTLTEYSDLVLGVRVRNGISPNITIKPMVRISTDSSDTYEAYTGQTVTINLGGTYYGGYLNVGTGLFTIDKVMIDLGDINYTYDSAYTRMYGLLPNGKALLARTMKMMCSCFAVIDDGRAVGDVPNNACYNGNAGGSTYVYIKEDSTTDANAFKTSVIGQKLVYELATPQTIQLTPAQVTQLLGENNVWCDSGDSEVDFFKIIQT